MGISNSQYNAIMREYDKIRSMHREDLRNREEEVRLRIPDFIRYQHQTGKRALEYYRNITDRNDTSLLSNFEKEIRGLGKQKEHLLQKFGFPSDYLELKYDCEHCRDTGYVQGRKCRCFQTKVIRMLYSSSNLDRILEKENFETFRFDYYDNTVKIPEVDMTLYEYMQSIFEVCREYADGFADTYENIMFTGNTGVGKTFLTNCIAKGLMDRGHSVLYFSAAQFFEKSANEKLRHEQDDDGEGGITELTEDCDLLIIDDLGTELTNTFTVSELFSVMQKRMHKRKPMIFSTNLDLKQLREIYTERISSRILSEYTIIKLFGEDIRKRK